jgi:hypothetical protein
MWMDMRYPEGWLGERDVTKSTIFGGFAVTLSVFWSHWASFCPNIGLGRQVRPDVKNVISAA